jgi:hypothetical protein
MKDALVGYTGLVGSNLTQQHQFEGLYNSKNIPESYGTQPELLVFAGVGGNLSVANANPEVDRRNCEQALDTIRRIQPQKLVLISTISVYPEFSGDENSKLRPNTVWGPYGNHRVQLEKETARIVPDCYIIRLGPCFGTGLRKNFLYDLTHPIPTSLTSPAYQEQLSLFPQIEPYYQLDQPSHNYQLKIPLSAAAAEHLAQTLGWDATRLTDSRTRLQFYPLDFLMQHIKFVLRESVPVINLVAEPLSAQEIYQAIRGSDFENIIKTNPNQSDYRSIYAHLLGSDSDYTFSKSRIMEIIKQFLGS